MSLECVYIATRADGWHKVGYSGRPKHRMGAIRAKLVREFWHEREGLQVEFTAHRLLDLAGHERQGEWFSASEPACVRAIKRAGRIVAAGQCESYRRAHRVFRRRKDDREVQAACLTRREHAILRDTPDDTLNKWIAIWKSDDYTTNDAALKAMGRPFNAVTANKLFGPSGRPPGGHRDNAR